MRLVKLRIQNYRGIRSAEFVLPQHVVLLGQNNSGKSSIIDAIALLLGRDRLVRTLGDYDFFGGNPQPADRISITGVLSDFVTDDPSNHPEWFNLENGGVACWFHPQDGTVAYDSVQPADTKLAVEIAFSGRYDREELEFEGLRYFLRPGMGDPFEEGSLHRVRTNQHLKELGFFLLPSKRTWERTISFGSELFNRVVKFQGALPSVAINNQRTELRTSTGMEDEPPLQAIVERLNNELRSFTTDGDKHLRFHVTTADLEGVMQAIVPFVEGKGNFSVPIGRHGSGLISLQTLLLLLEFGKYRNDNNQGFFLAAEEPELHLQPGIHRRLVARIRGLSHQSISTTHSPQVASYYKPDEIHVLKNDDGNLSVRPLLSSPIPAANALMRLYTLYRFDVCEALMYNRVLVPEGKTEHWWFNKLNNAVVTAEGWGAYDGSEDITQVFGVIPTQSATVVDSFSQLNPVSNSCIPLVDGDAAGNGYLDQLKVLGGPPPLILQWGVDRAIEDTISWIVRPDAARIQQVKDATEDFEGQSLSEFLGSDEAKTKWDYHEAVVEVIMQHHDSVRRARRLLNSIAVLPNQPDGLQELWTEDAGKSTPNSRVFVFQYP